MKKRKNTWKNIIAVICIAIIAYGAVVLFAYNLHDEEPVTDMPTPSPSVLPAPSPTLPPEWLLSQEDESRLHDLYEEDHAMNADVKGILSFQSGLIEEPILQGTSNDSYLRTDWKTGGYLSWGSVEMDYRNDPMNDQNTLLYGHYVYPERTPDRTIMFTPLLQLEQQENYADNQFLNIVTDQQIITYQIAYVFDCPIVDVQGGQAPAEGYAFNDLTYDQDSLAYFLDHVKQSEYYDTGVEITDNDRWLTMQTCVEGTDYHREIVIAKEIDRREINS